MTIKYYLYLSEVKVEMLYAQIPRDFLSGLAGELKVSFGVVNTTLKQGAAPETKYAKLSAVVRYLEEHKKVGSVEQPEEYFRGVMRMKWGPYNEEGNKPSLLVYLEVWVSTPLSDWAARLNMSLGQQGGGAIGKRSFLLCLPR